MERNTKRQTEGEGGERMGGASAEWRMPAQCLVTRKWAWNY